MKFLNSQHLESAMLIMVVTILSLYQVKGRLLESGLL